MADAAQAPGTPATPVPGSPEHDAAMLAKYNAAQQPAGAPPADGQPPAELILGKFKTQDDLVKAYAELEKKLSGAKPETPSTPDPAKPPVADGKVNWEAVGAEIKLTGALSDGSREALKALGIPDEVMDSYVSASSTAVASFRTTLEAEAGGAEQFETIRTWAATALSDGEKAALQKMVEGGLDTAKLAISTMRARYEAANGAPPASPVGGRAPGSSSVGYASTQEMVRDMANPMYQNDPAFRAQVEARLAATTAF
jgi:hypothetical protein